MATVEIGTLKPGDLCIMDYGRIAKVLVQQPDAEDVPAWNKKGRTIIENDLGNRDWVWDNYKVQVD